ncbi:MAG: divergent polysaccharide deacetylase family protein [Methylocella sp.]
MTDDDLDSPLGQFPVQKRPSRGNAVYAAVAIGGLGLLAVLAAFLPSLVRPPGGALYAANGVPASGAAPHETPAGVSKNLPRNAPPPQTGGAGASETASPLQDSTATVPPRKAGLGAEAVERRSGVKIIRGGGGAAPEAVIIDVAKALNTGLPAAPDPQLIERTPHGPIPGIGAGGARPSEGYVRPAGSSGGLTKGLPRIALLIGGMGLAPRATESAIATLPAAVTLGFAPYGADLARETARAREAGHEVVLQIPMEPFDFPRDNPGPHTLLAGAGKAANIENLRWLMSRFTGYAGVANFLGGKLTADAKALTPVLHAIAARGLFYVDDGTSSQSLAMTLAPGQALAAARADVVLDSTADPAAIEAALARLEAIARDKGVAIGVASALPASIAIIGRFARALEAQGIALIPLSAAMPSRQPGLAIGSSTMR